MAENFIEKIREIVVANFSVKSLEKIRQIAIQKIW